MTSSITEAQFGGPTGVTRGSSPRVVASWLCVAGFRRVCLCRLPPKNGGVRSCRASLCGSASPRRRSMAHSGALVVKALAGYRDELPVVAIGVQGELDHAP